MDNRERMINVYLSTHIVFVYKHRWSQSNNWENQNCDTQTHHGIGNCCSCCCFCCCCCYYCCFFFFFFILPLCAHTVFTKHDIHTHTCESSFAYVLDVPLCLLVARAWRAVYVKRWLCIWRFCFHCSGYSDIAPIHTRKHKHTLKHKLTHIHSCSR